MQVEGTRVKWVLLSPCLFNAGWLPDWVDPGSGAVMLRDAPLREDYDSRRLWRQALNQAPAIGAQLVAARVKGAVHFSGWSTNKDEKGELGPRQTLAAVPAGSVYYFEASDQQQARLLVKQLHGTTKSSRYGEQGFGLGVCGKWSMTG